jgi:hypothetical protein
MPAPAAPASILVFKPYTPIVIWNPSTGDTRYAVARSQDEACLP